MLCSQHVQVFFNKVIVSICISCLDFSCSKRGNEKVGLLGEFSVKQIKLGKMAFKRSDDRP